MKGEITMPTLRTLMTEIGHMEAIREILFGEDHANRKCIEHFLRGYEGNSPYFGFVLKNVSRPDLPLFLSSGLDYAPFDAELLSIKANLPTEEESAADTATQKEGV